MHDYQGARAIVVGGSIGGLTSALLLRNLGFDVDVFERTPSPLDNRGGGIVLQPITMKWFDGHSARRIEELSVTSRWLRYLGPADDVQYQGAFVWRSTSWGTVYRALLGDFGSARYHLGQTCVGFSQNDEEVELRFVTGRVERADLVVFADGITSTGRRLLYPAVQPRYSGYVGWRGTVREDRICERARALLADAITYSVAPNTHAVMYTIPGMDGELERGKRLLNYVWYRNVADGPELHELLTDTDGSKTRCRFTRVLLRKGVRDIGVIEPQVVHTYRPLLSYVGGGQAPMRAAERTQRSVTPRGCSWLRDAVVAVDADRNTVRCASGKSYRYRDLVLGVGLVPDDDALPGIGSALETPAVASNYLDLAEKTWQLVQSLPRGGRAVFTVPRAPVSCTGTTIKPLFLAAAHWSDPDVCPVPTSRWSSTVRNCWESRPSTRGCTATSTTSTCTCNSTPR